MRKCIRLWALSALILAAVLTWTDPGLTQPQGAENLKKPHPSQLALVSTMPIKLDKVKKGMPLTNRSCAPPSSPSWTRSTSTSNWPI
jgi:hypothetical protein